MVIKNYGISFGQNMPALVLVSGVVWLILWWWAVKEKSWALGLAVIGGGLNLGERIAWGYVADYWRIPGTSLYNNLNDWLIFIGLGWYLISKWKQQSK